METKFDPDDIDVTNDPEYAARTHAPGPMTRILWAPDGGPSMAKRAEMLEIDREMNARWIVAMEKLLLEPLTDAEFTTQRMLRLKLWTRERKRLQHNLHYKYDPSRRRPRLVELDVKKMQEKLQAQMTNLYTLHPERAPQDWTPTELKSIAPRSTGGRAARPVPTPIEHEIPYYLDPSTIRLIAQDTGIRDPSRATDEAILEAYAARGQAGYIADYHLALLRGRAVPDRPEELG